MDKETLVVECVCGGWVMLSALRGDDYEAFREAAKLVKKGFRVRTPVPMSIARNLEACPRWGDCTTNPDRPMTDAQKEACGQLTAIPEPS